jgi:hypothetical protein
MNEYSFIGFDVAADSCGLQLPVNEVSDLRFFIPETVSGETFSSIDIVDTDNEIIRACVYDFADGFISLKTTSISDLTCFKLAFNYSGGMSFSVYYSALFRYVSDITETTLVKYLCYEPQFGFAYNISNSYNQVRLPILIKNPQFPQEDKVYIDGNGVRRLISSKIDKEYELETEYIPQDWHEKLIIALSHDEVYFDTVRLQKSSPYEIDYEEEDKLSCGTILNKASAKMTKNTTIRNNNC